MFRSAFMCGECGKIWHTKLASDICYKKIKKGAIIPDKGGSPGTDFIFNSKHKRAWLKVNRMLLKITQAGDKSVNLEVFVDDVTGEPIANVVFDNNRGQISFMRG